MKPTLEPWRFERIAKTHDRQGFECGIESLNLYLPMKVIGPLFS